MPNLVEQLKRQVEELQEKVVQLEESNSNFMDRYLSHAHQGGEGNPIKVKVREKSGAWTASELAENEIGIDSSNGRLYFVYGGAVHYCTQDA